MPNYNITPGYRRNDNESPENQDTRFARIDAVMNELRQGGQVDFARNDGAAYLYQLRIMQILGIYEPLSAEQTALNALLTYLKAGKRTTDFAWRLFAQSLDHP